MFNSFASFTSIIAPEKISSFAFHGPTILGRKYNVPKSGIKPTLLNVNPNLVDGLANTMSHDRANLTVEDIGYFECNEAFAPVVLSWMKELNVPLDKVNVRGGAIALGHPTGASGARLMTTLVNILEDKNAKYGLQVMCAGGGMSAATIIEKV